MKKVNPHAIKAIIDIVLITLSVIAIALCFSGCNAEKRLEKAKQEVLTDSASFDYVGRKFVALNPCTNKIIYKSDTIYQYDTTETFTSYTDTFNHTDTVVKTIKLTAVKTIHDTATVIDGQQVQLLQSQLAQRNLQIAQMNGQILSANDATKDATKRGNKFLYWLIAVVSMVGIGYSIKIYTSLKPKIL